MKLESLSDLYVDQLKDLHSAEKQILKALPRMVDAAQQSELKDAFKDHLAETEGHVRRLDRILQSRAARSASKTCKAREGLIDEGDEYVTAKKDVDPRVRDAALIAAAQRVEHYEIASYGTARAFAQILGDEEGARLLQETLDEEGAADKRLTEVASTINLEAAENAGTDR